MKPSKNVVAYTRQTANSIDITPHNPSSCYIHRISGLAGNMILVGGKIKWRDLYSVINYQQKGGGRVDQLIFATSNLALSWRYVGRKTWGAVTFEIVPAFENSDGTYTH